MIDPGPQWRHGGGLVAQFWQDSGKDLTRLAVILLHGAADNINSRLKGAVDRELGGKYIRLFSCFPPSFFVFLIFL